MVMEIWFDWTDFIKLSSNLKDKMLHWL